MKDWSCQANLLSFYEEVSRNVDKAVAVNIVYLGFAKDFVIVFHRCPM